MVQDSYYKNVHNGLPLIVSEMGEAIGWTVMQRHDYLSPRHMARVHPSFATYRRSARATESVLILKKSA